MSRPFHLFVDLRRVALTEPVSSILHAGGLQGWNRQTLAWAHLLFIAVLTSCCTKSVFMSDFSFERWVMGVLVTIAFWSCSYLALLTSWAPKTSLLASGLPTLQCLTQPAIWRQNVFTGTSEFPWPPLAHTCLHEAASSEFTVLLAIPECSVHVSGPYFLVLFLRSLV